jgi:hypothetical protein
MIVRVKGEARTDCVGALMDDLPVPTARCPELVTLDLSELCSLSHLALGVLRIFCRDVVHTGGRVRLSKDLQPEVKRALRSFSPAGCQE